MSNHKRRVFRWGTHFKSGKLYLFTNKAVLVLKGWPELRAWRKTAVRQQWKPVRPDINIKEGWVHAGRTTPRRNASDVNGDATFFAFPQIHLMRRERQGAGVPPTDWSEEAEQKARDACALFFDGFPVHVRGRVGEFSSRQWHMAVLLLRCPGAWDLVRTNPALAFCLASNWVFRSPRPAQPLRDARRWIRCRQRDIAGWLGFPGTEQTVNLLRKIPPEACNVSLLLHFRQALRQTEIAATLRHFPRLTATVLRIVADPRLRPLATPRLLRELSANIVAWGVVSEHIRTFLDTLALAATLVPPRPLPVFDSLAQLTRHHDELVAELNLKGLSEPEHLVFPPPPIPGHETIVPLTAPAMLLEEGREQQNCVVTYAQRVARGNQFIYRVLAPERATLQIVQNRRGWRIGELSGPRNEPVTEATRIAVQHWLSGEGWDKDWTPF